MLGVKELALAAGVSGREAEVRKVILSRLKELGVTIITDAMGNVIASKGTGSTRVLLAAHMDEVGLMVAGIDKDGLIHFKKVGGIDDRVLLSKAVLIGEDKVPGVIGSKPVHRQDPSERQSVIAADQLYIDIGASSREEATRWVRPGDPVVFLSDYAEENGIVRSKALDDRLGCAILLKILESEYRLELNVAFTVQEEVGLRGAKVAAYRVNPHLAVVVEGTLCSDLPEIPEHAWVTRLGFGPALSVMDAASLPNRAMLNSLQETAEELRIQYQLRETTAGANDAGAIHLSRGGVPTASVSVPCRYLHSPCSLASLQDAERAFMLVDGFLRKVERGLAPWA
ncbi:MAG: M42 family metallopeptidase [Bacillota bacterium]